MESEFISIFVEIKLMARPRKFTLNQDYFSEIKTENQAYWLGYLYADGTIINRKRIINNKEYHQYMVVLTSVDKDIISKFLLNVGCNKLPAKYKNKSGFYTKEEYYAAFLTSEKMFKDLEKLGCFEKKSLKLKFPNFLDKSLISHFIRGYFDGDGSIYLTRTKAKTSKNCIRVYNKPAIHICGTLEFLSGLIDYLPFLNNTKTVIKKEKRRLSNTYYLRFDGYQRVINFYNLFYKDSNIYLDRKMSKFKECFKVRASTTIIGNPIRGIYKRPY